MTDAQTQYDDNRADPSDERIAWDARIVAAMEKLASAESELQHERKREQDLSFAAEKLADELRGTISGTRRAMEEHLRIIHTIAQVLSSCLSIMDQRRAAGEAARSVHKDRLVCVTFAENTLADEYKLGFISAYSRTGKMINEVRLEIDRRENRARAPQPGQRHIEFSMEKDLPAFMRHSERIMTTLVKRSSRGRLGVVSRTLTRSILVLTGWMLPNRSDDLKMTNKVAWRLLPLNRILVSIRGMLYERTELDRNTRERLILATKEDALISRILGARVTAAENRTRNRYEILKWNDAVSRLPWELSRLKQLHEEWRVQTKVTHAAVTQHSRYADALHNAMIEYETLHRAPWQPRARGPIVIAAPVLLEVQTPKKPRNAQEYNKNPGKARPEKHERLPRYFATRQTDRWRKDLMELSADHQHAFSVVAETISCQEPRKSIGSSQGRTFYSIPIGESGRIVYSIDSGIAILERAFGTDSRHDNFRKFRKDIQKGII